MEFLKKNKALIGVIAVLLIVVYVYLTYFRGGSSAILTTTEDTTSAVSPTLLATLSNLHTIRLDNAIFSDPVFQSLTDFGVQIPAQNVGRRNPFAPLGGI